MHFVCVVSVLQVRPICWFCVK